MSSSDCDNLYYQQYTLPDLFYVYFYSTGKWCYMFRDWDTLPKLRRVYNGIGDSVTVGIADCQYSRFSERWQDLNEAIEADVFKIVENAARIKSFVTGKYGHIFGPVLSMRVL